MCPQFVLFKVNFFPNNVDTKFDPFIFGIIANYLNLYNFNCTRKLSNLNQLSDPDWNG